MTHRNTATTTGPSRRALLVLLAAFTTALLWWIGAVGVITTGGGALIFLTIPALATIGTIKIRNRTSRRWPIRPLQRRHKHRNLTISGTRHTVVLLATFASALLWWIGIAGLISTGPTGAQVFLPVPVLATVGTLIIALSHPQGRATSPGS